MPSTGMEVLTPLAQALQLSLGLVFVAAVVPKARDPRAFARTVAQYRLGPRRAAPVLARGLIVVEAFLALALVTGVLVAVALPLALAVLLVFAAAVTVNLRRNRKIPCGCFGAQSETISGRSLARLGLLVAAAAFLTVVNLAADPPPLAAAPSTGQVVAIGGLSAVLLVIGMWLLHLPEAWSVMSQLWRPPQRVEVDQRREAA